MIAKICGGRWDGLTLQLPCPMPLHCKLYSADLDKQAGNTETESCPPRTVYLSLLDSLPYRCSEDAQV